MAPTQWRYALTVLAALLGAASAGAANLTITPAQRGSAQAAASQGVPTQDIKPDAPDRYTVRRGDTLWGISNLYLRSPWQWPLLWGMNLGAIANPHRIYPGQTLVLVRRDGRALLQLEAAPTGAASAADLPNVRLSPHTRTQALPDTAIPTLDNRVIEPFLVEPMIVDADTLQQAPRIVAAADGRVLLTRGDRAYARSSGNPPLTDDPKAPRQRYRLFRNANVLKDPLTAEVLGHEAQSIGLAELMRSEDTQAQTDANGKVQMQTVPATLDILAAKEEIRVGDRLLPEPARNLDSYTPYAPQTSVDARVVSVYGSAVAFAAQNQVVAVNKGHADGLRPGAVLAILKDGASLIDTTDPLRPTLKLPDERNGLLMVFRVFDRVSYALVLAVSSGVRVGDHLVNPR